MSSDKILKVVTIVVLVHVAVVLVAVLCLVWSLPDLPKTEQTDNICLPDESGKIKCGNSADLLHTYLHQWIDKTYNEIRNREKTLQEIPRKDNNVRLQSLLNKYYLEMKPAAKLTGKDQDVTRKSDNYSESEMVPIREWCHGRELHDTNGFERYGIRYRKGRLVVPVSGTYFVYSFVDLFEPCDKKTGQPDVKDPNKPIKHSIYKFNILDEDETEIISSVQPHTVSSNSYFNSYASYISSLTELKAGDELSVKVSNLTYLRYTRDNTFGVYLV